MAATMSRLGSTTDCAYCKGRTYNDDDIHGTEAWSTQDSSSHINYGS